jgi:hypothetical protein
MAVNLLCREFVVQPVEIFHGTLVLQMGPNGKGGIDTQIDKVLIGLQ